MGLDEDNKLCFAPTYVVWLQKHDYAVEDYLKTCVNIDSWEYVKDIFYKNPFIGMMTIQDFITNNEDIDDNRRKTIGYLMEEGHEISVTSGSRGSGKTAKAVTLIEEAQHTHSDIEKVYVGAPNRELERHGWNTVANIDGLHKGDMAVQDEAALFLGSRRSMSEYNVQILENLPTLRHVEVKGWMVITQSTKRMDVGVLDYANAHIVQTYSDAFSLDVERGIISDDLILEFLLPRENYIRKSNVKDWSFVRTGKFLCLMYAPMVYWYSDLVGKAFNRFDNDGDALEWAVAMFMADDYDVSYMRRYMKVRGLSKPKEYWKDLKERVQDGEYVSNAGIRRNGEELHEIQPLIEESSETMDYYNSLLKKNE